MKKHITTIFLSLGLLTGLSLLLYPTFSDWWNSFHQSRAIDSYVQMVEGLDEEAYAQASIAAQEYNETLLSRPNDFLLSKEQQKIYDSLLNIDGNGIMGYLEISKINVMLPVYHSTEESVLQVAVGHLEWTSLPVGGESSHCVLSGHRGLPSARLFTDLDKLEAGDVFSLHVLGEEITYQVDQILVVEPHETEELMIVEGKDLCTLVTCTPYGINSHRLLVRGHRVETVTETAPTRLTADAIRVEPTLVVPFAAVPVLVGLLVWLCIPEKRNRRRWDEIA